MDYILIAVIWLTIGWLIVVKAGISATFAFITWTFMGEKEFAVRIKWLAIALWPIAWLVLNLATRYIAKKHNVELKN